VTDTQLRAAERLFRQSQTAIDLLSFWSLCLRSQHLMEISIVPRSLFLHTEVSQFLKSFDTAHQFSFLGIPLQELFRRLYLVSHNSLYIQGWSSGHGQVEGASPALTGIDLCHVFWDPDETPGTGQFHAQLGHNHHFTITICYTNLVEFFLPLSKCILCGNLVNIIDITDLSHTPFSMERINRHLNTRMSSIFNVEADCLDIDNVVCFEHTVTLRSLIADPSSDWLLLPIPETLDRPSSYPEPSTWKKRSSLELPGLLGSPNGVALFIE
jgi:hypothetical protein